MFTIHPQPPLPEVLELPQYRLVQPLFKQPDYLKRGDRILLVQGNEWTQVKLDSHSGTKNATNGSLYWNYSNLDGSNPRGGYLFPNQAWGVLRGDDIELDITQVQLLLPNDIPANVVNQPALEAEGTHDNDSEEDLVEQIPSDEDSVVIQQISDLETSSSP